MKYSNVENLPENPKEIMDYALLNSFTFWVDEKGTKDNPSIFQRKLSSLSYEQAFKIIQQNKPHWVVSFRNVSYITKNEKDYWEFGGCNIASNVYGEVFIWIHVAPTEAEKIFEKFNLKLIQF